MSQAQAHPSLASTDRPARRSFPQRLLGAVRLDPAAWDEIVRDPKALAQAAAVALVAALAAGVASGVGHTTATGVQGGVGTLVTCSLLGLVLWAIANWFRHPVGLGTAFRVVGFAMAPLALVALAAIPVALLQTLVRLVAVALFFAALVVGTRQALQVETARAAFVCLVVGMILIFASMLVVTLSL
jgi:hypothetical protein